MNVDIVFVLIYGLENCGVVVWYYFGFVVDVYFDYGG